MTKIIVCCAFAAAQIAAASFVSAADAAPDEQARIAFADMGGIRNWRAEEADTLFVQSRRGQWYRAELFSSCSGLPFAHTIGFVFEPDGSLDRFSSVVVDGRECQIKSLVKSEGPGAADKSSNPSTSSTQSPWTLSASNGESENAGDNASEVRKDARIPFVEFGGIENWRATDDDTLYIEGRNDQWYRAELHGFCPGLQFETAIGFVTRPIGAFDEFSSIVVDGRECHLKSLTKSSPPPEKG